MRTVIAFLCAASAFPAMLFGDERWPTKPAPERIAWEPGRSWYHHQKNIWTETIRADCEWFGKFLAFTICLLTLIAILT